MLRNHCLWCAFLILFACKQSDKNEKQEQFRERQRTTREQASELPPAGAARTDETVAEASPAPTPAAVAGDKVVGVKDGDTIELLRNGRKITVRLYGVDTPEKAQAYGQRARQFTAALVFGKHVRLIVHNTDRYGRTVGTVILPDGSSLNEELVRQGYAWHYKAYAQDRNLANAEADARRLKRGLWQDPAPVAPWDFRKEKRSNRAAHKAAAAPLSAAPSSKRTVYLCNSSGAKVYHLDKGCHVLRRCKAEIVTVPETAARNHYNRRADKSCSND